MSIKLKIVLLIFSIIWISAVYLFVKRKKINIRNSIIWFITGFIIMFISVFSFVLESVASLFGFYSIVHMVIGVFITILLVLTLRLSIIVTEQKEQIRELIQEISLLKKDKDEK